MVTKLDRDFVNAGLNGLRTSETVIEALANEVERLEVGLGTALELLRAAKLEFAPDTTNSSADVFLTEWS